MAVRGGETKTKFLINCAYFAIIAVIAFLAVKYLLGWIMPLLVGFIIAAAVQPAVRYCEKHGRFKTKALSVAFVLILFGLLALCAVLIFSRLAASLYAGAADFPAMTGCIIKSLDALAQKISPLLQKISAGTGIKIDTSLSGISTQLLKFSQLPAAAAQALHSAVVFLPSFLLDIVVTIIAACFIAADYKAITGFLLRLLPARYHRTVCDLKKFFFSTVLRLIRAYLLLMLITFCELLCGLILLRVGHPVLLAAAIALVDILPVLGTGTIMIPWAAVEFLLGNMWLGAGLALVYAVITVVRNILEPKIVGKHIGLHPLATLAAMFVGLKAAGVAGMIILPVGVLIFKYLFDSGIIKLPRR